MFCRSELTSPEIVITSSLDGKTETTSVQNRWGHTMFDSPDISLYTTATDRHPPKIRSATFAMHHGVDTSMVMTILFPRQPLNLPGNLGGVEILNTNITS